MTSCENVLLEEVDPQQLYPNDWNPNRLTELKYEALKESIRLYPNILEGQRIIVRKKPTQTETYQILNGEHRWRCSLELKFKKIPVAVVDIPDDSEAKLVSLALANVGEEDYDKKLSIISEIQKDYTISDIANLIGEDRNKLATLVDDLTKTDVGAMADLFDKYSAETEPTDHGGSFIHTGPPALAGIINLDLEKLSAPGADIPSMIKLPVSGEIRKAIQLGLDKGQETIYAVIKEACKLYIKSVGGE